MPRLTAPARLTALVVALLLPMLAWSVPAHADPLIPSQASLNVYGGWLEDDTLVHVSAHVDHYPSNPVPQGTFAIRDDHGNVIRAAEPLDSFSGGVTFDIAKPSVQTTYYADYHSTNGYTDVTASSVYTPRYTKVVTVKLQPTILKVSGLVPQLTLTLGATFKLKDGTPVRGIAIYFYTGCPPGPSRDCNLNVPLCSAVSDVNGLASCKGSGLLGSVVSILNGAVQYYTKDLDHPAGFYEFNYPTVPIPLIA